MDETKQDKTKRGHLSPTERKRVRLAVRESRARKKAEEEARLKSISCEQTWSGNLAKLTTEEKSALEARQARYDDELDRMAYVLTALADDTNPLINAPDVPAEECLWRDIEKIIKFADDCPPCFGRLDRSDIEQATNPTENVDLAKQVFEVFRQSDPDWLLFGKITRFTRQVYEDFVKAVAVTTPETGNEIGQRLIREYENSPARQLERQSEQARQACQAFRLPPSESAIVANQQAREYRRTLQQMTQSLRSQHPVLGPIEYPDS